MKRGSLLDSYLVSAVAFCVGIHQSLFHLWSLHSASDDYVACKKDVNLSSSVIKFLSHHGGFRLQLDSISGQIERLSRLHLYLDSPSHPVQDANSELWRPIPIGQIPLAPGPFGGAFRRRLKLWWSPVIWWCDGGYNLAMHLFHSPGDSRLRLSTVSISRI